MNVDGGTLSLIRSDGSGWICTSLQEQRATLTRPSLDLSQTVAEIEAAGDRRDEIREWHRQVDETLAKSAQACRDRQPNENDVKSFKVKFKKCSESFARTALHYQTVFDVLNEQAPEYTSAAWGATKLIFLFVVNGAELKTNVEESLEKMALRFAELNIITGISAHEEVDKALSRAYSLFLEFLHEVLKFYKENRAHRWLNYLIKTWKTRFEPKLQAVETQITSVRNLVNARSAKQVAGIDQRTRQIDHKLDYSFAALGSGVSMIGSKVDNMCRIMSALNERQYEAGRGIEIETSVQQLIEAFNTQAKFVRDQTLLEAKQEISRPATPMRQRIHVPDENGRSLFGGSRAVDNTPLSDYASDTSSLTHFFARIYPDQDVICTDRDVLLQRLVSEPEDLSGSSYNLSRNADVLSWLRATSSQLMWIDGFRERNTFSWTANFGLELLTVADKSNITCLHVFGNEILSMVGRDQNGLCVALQSLIYQILVSKLHIFESISICRKHDLTVQRLDDAKDNIPELLEILKQLLEISELNNLLIIVDGIDDLLLHSHENTEEEFPTSEQQTQILALLRFLKVLSLSEKSCVKVLITSYKTGIPLLLDKPGDVPTDKQRHRVVLIPRQEVLIPNRFESRSAKQSYIADIEPDSPGDLEVTMDALRAGKDFDEISKEKARRQSESRFVSNDAIDSDDDDDFGFRRVKERWIVDSDDSEDGGKDADEKPALSKPGSSDDDSDDDWAARYNTKRTDTFKTRQKLVTEALQEEGYNFETPVTISPVTATHATNKAAKSGQNTHSRRLWDSDSD